MRIMLTTPVLHANLQLLMKQYQRSLFIRKQLPSFHLDPEKTQSYRATKTSYSMGIGLHMRTNYVFYPHM